MRYFRNVDPPGRSNRKDTPKSGRRVQPAFTTSYTPSSQRPVSNGLSRHTRPLPSGPGPLDDVGKKLSNVAFRPRQNVVSRGPMKADHSKVSNEFSTPSQGKTNDWFDDISSGSNLDASKKTRSVTDLTSRLAKTSVSGNVSKQGNYGSQNSLHDIGSSGRRDSSGSNSVTHRTAPTYSPEISSMGRISRERQNNADSLSEHGSPIGHSSHSGLETCGLVGLRNLGNTCFMNSILQCLSNTKPLLEYCINDDYILDINQTTSHMKGALVKSYANLMKDIWKKGRNITFVSPMSFKSSVQRFAPRFVGYNQQDAQEFLRYLLEGLHEDVNRVTSRPKRELPNEQEEDRMRDSEKAQHYWKRYLRIDNSKIVDIFVGQLKSTLKCTDCGYCSTTFDPFWDLSLPIPKRGSSIKLEDCIQLFTQEEVLDGDEKPTCARCKARRKCTKSFMIQKLPRILVLHLKRFSQERYRGKLTTVVNFPVKDLDLSPFTADKYGAGSTKYNLYAVSNHSGTTYSGHYTAYVKHPYTGDWHEYNDSRVHPYSSRNVTTTEGYVLFYELATTSSRL